MPTLDVFHDDAFGCIQLTEALNLLPYQPGRVGEMGLFQGKGIALTTALIEERRGVLSLLPSLARGAPATQAARGGRKVRAFAIPHIPYEDAVLASEVQNVRKFGTEDQLEGVSDVVNDRLDTMKQAHQVTLEFMRLSALKGVLVDGAGTTLYDLATEFNVSKTADLNFALGTTTTDVGAKCIAIVNTIKNALGAFRYDHIHALVGPIFWQKLTSHPEVKYAFQYWQESKFLREDPRTGFEYKGITFEEYRGAIGTTSFINEASYAFAHFFPVGVQGMYVEAYAPADFIEAVNTIGLPMYAKQERMEFDRGIKLHVQSNPLPLCTLPAALCNGYSAL